MKKLNTYLALVISLLNLISVFAQKQIPPVGGAPKDFKLPERQTKILKNGLKTTLVQYGIVPKVSISLIVKTGNVHEASNEVWLANLTGEMLRQGTAKMDFITLSKKVAEMGGKLNVNVSMDQITIGGSVLSEFAPDFIEILSDLAINPSFPGKELERLKGDLKRTLSVQKAVPQSQAQELFFKTIYKDHPYGWVFSTDSMLNSFTLGKAKDFYTKNFGAKRSALYVVGKYNAAKVTSAIETAFGKWTEGPGVIYPPVQVSNKLDTVILDRKTAPQTTIMIGLSTLTPKDSNYIPQIIANSLLGGSFGSRITSNIRENKGYTYSPYSYIQNHPGSSLWIETADVTSEHTIEALREIEKEIKRLQTEPPSKEELKGIQNLEGGSFVLNNSSPDAIIYTLNFLDLYGLNSSYLTSYVKEVNKVTPQKVSEIAKSNFPCEKMTLIMVGDKEQIQKQIAKRRVASPGGF